MIIWRDDEWLAVADATIPSDDRGYLLGDGLFETMQVRHGKLIRSGFHIRRLLSSCDALELACSIKADDFDDIVQSLCVRNGLDNAVIRLTLSAGSGPRGLERSGEGSVSCLIRASEWREPPESLSLVVSDIRREASSLATRHKTLSYIDNIGARVRAKKSESDMALMLTPAGHVSGCDCANVFWVSDGKLFTPSLDCAVLPGSVRAFLVQTMDVTEGQYTLEDVLKSDHVFVTNALMGAVGVSSINNQDFFPSCAQLDLAKKVLA